MSTEKQRNELLDALYRNGTILSVAAAEMIREIRIEARNARHEQDPIGRLNEPGKYNAP